MPFDHTQQFAILLFSGIGLVLSAWVNFALREAERGRRATITIVAAASAVLACGLHDSDARLAGAVAITLLGTIAVLLLLGSSFGHRMLTSFADRMRLPLGAWRIGGILGAAVIAFAAARHTYFDDAKLDAEIRDLTALETLQAADDPRFEPVSDIRATTDTGTPVELLRRLDTRPIAFLSQVEDELFQSEWRQDDVIRTAPPDDRVNCYGWLFTGGRHWVPGSAMGAILRENGYKPVKAPAVGDLVAYRNGEAIVHLGVVRYVSPQRPAIVEGKWGASGVFLHQVDRSIYGGDYLFLRSPRAGHLLEGLPPETPRGGSRIE